MIGYTDPAADAAADLMRQGCCCSHVMGTTTLPEQVESPSLVRIRNLQPARSLIR